MDHHDMITANKQSSNPQYHAQKYNRSAERPVTRLPTLPVTNQEPSSYLANTVIPAKLKV